MGNLCIVNLPIGLEHPKDDPREDPVEMKNALYRSYGMELPDLDARMTEMWLLTAIITQESAASGADTRKAILAPSRLVSICNQLLNTTNTGVNGIAIPTDEYAI